MAQDSVSAGHKVVTQTPSLSSCLAQVTRGLHGGRAEQANVSICDGAKETDIGQGLQGWARARQPGQGAGPWQTPPPAAASAAGNGAR